MALNIPASVVAGEFVDENDWNAMVDSLTFLASPPAVRVRKSNQNITNVTDTLLTWDLEDYDPTGMHSTVTNTGRLTALVAGIYLFTLQPDWDGNATGQRTCVVGKNTAGTPPALGANRLGSSTGHTRADVEIPVVGVIKLAVNDYIEAFTYQDSGGTRVFGGAQRVTASFTMTWQGLGT